MVEFEVHGNGIRILEASFLVSGMILYLSQQTPYSLPPVDSSEYPSHHQFYASSPTDDASPRLVEALNDVSDYPSLPVMAAVDRLMAKFVKLQPQVTSSQSKQPLSPRTNTHTDDEEAEDDEDEDEYAYDYDDLEASQGIGHAAVKGEVLQRYVFKSSHHTAHLFTILRQLCE